MAAVSQSQPSHHSAPLLATPSSASAAPVLATNPASLVVSSHGMFPLSSPLITTTPQQPQPQPAAASQPQFLLPTPSTPALGSAQQQLLAAQLAAAAVGSNGPPSGTTTTQAPSGPMMGQLALNPLAGIGPQLAPAAVTAQHSAPAAASPGMLFMPRLP